MSLTFNMTGGGGGLNFSIKKYSVGTDLSQVVGQENEIAVLTDDNIIDWAVSMQAPENPQSGDVWVKSATASKNTIEALKRHSIVLSLHGAFQYTGGAWIRKKTYLWQNNQWKDMDIFLYDNGDRCTDVTGGWGENHDSNGRVYFRDTYIEHVGATSSNGTYSHTVNKVNLSGYTKLKAKLYVSSYSGDSDAQRLWLGLFSNIGTAYPTQIIGKVIAMRTGDQTLELDISAYKNSSYYVGFRSNKSSGKIYEIWLE